MNKLMIDLGCGSCKKEGTIGVDIQALPGVDFAVDLRVEPLPFPDQSVKYVHSSHFFEHISDPTKIFAEIGRVCVDGAKLELWTPYAWSNSAFIIDHKLFLNEDHYYHMCVWFVDFWERILKSRWILKELQYVISPETLVDLYKNNVSLDFAIKYYKGIVKEFCAHIEVYREYSGEVPEVKRTFSTERYSKKYLIKDESNQGKDTDDITQLAIKRFTLCKV